MAFRRLIDGCRMTASSSRELNNRTRLNIHYNSNANRKHIGLLYIFVVSAVTHNSKERHNYVR